MSMEDSGPLDVDALVALGILTDPGTTAATETSAGSTGGVKTKTQLAAKQEESDDVGGAAGLVDPHEDPLHDEELFNELFERMPDEGGDKGPEDAIDERSEAPAGEVLRCSTCGMSSLDPDLSDPRGSTMTPFPRASTSSSAALACTHCTNLLRLGGCRSITTAIERNTADGRKELAKLATYLAMKAASTDGARVHQPALEKQTAIVDQYTRIHAALVPKDPLARPTASSQPEGADGRRAIALDSYLNRFGNPLTNGDTVVQSESSECVGLMVLTNRSTEKGRYGLSDVVTSSSSGVQADAMVQAMKRMAVDDLPVLTVVQHIVAEYNARATLRQLTGRRGLATASMARSEVSARSANETVAPAVVSPAKGRTADISASGAVPAEQHAGTAGTSGKSVASGHVGMRRMPSRQSIGSPTAATSSPLARKPSQMSFGGGTSIVGSRASPREEAVPAMQTANDDEDITAIEDKGLMKLAKKLDGIVRIFMNSDWTTTLKGKERSLQNLRTALEERSQALRATESEHLLGEVDYLHSVVEATLVLVQKGKAKQFSPLELVEPLNTLTKYIGKCFTSAGEKDVVLDVSLQKLRVILCQKGQGPILSETSAEPGASDIRYIDLFQTQILPGLGEAWGYPH